LEYYKASVGITNADASDNSVRVNASKLRQIIRAADPELLRKVAAIHEQMQKREPVRPLYHAMVDVCRHRLETGRRKVSDATIRRILKRPAKHENGST
jgi:hypothetical protein